MHTLRLPCLTASAARSRHRARGPGSAEPTAISRSTIIAGGRPFGPAVKHGRLRSPTVEAGLLRGDAVPAPLAPPWSAELSTAWHHVHPSARTCIPKKTGAYATPTQAAWGRNGTDELVGQLAGDAAGDIGPHAWPGGHPVELSGAEGIYRTHLAGRSEPDGTGPCRPFTPD